MLTEACKNVETARMFVRDVAKLAKKYNANYFIVTDGASGTSNNGNPAVKNARDAQIKWEKEHGFDPDEDWTNESVEIEESILFSNEDIEYNIDSFVNGKNKFLYVIGYSGSGKSTITNEYSKKYNAWNISGDLFTMCIIHQFDDDIPEQYKLTSKNFKGGPFVQEYLNIYGTGNVKQGDRKTMFNSKEMMQSFQKFIIWLENKYKKGNDKFIIEGLQLLYFDDLEFFKDKSMVIKGTSIVTSYIRKQKRDLSKNISWDRLKNSLVGMIPLYIDHYKKINHIEKIISESEEIEEKMLVDSEDIYYNKDKFDSGEINLCFIVGHSGSGKSTMARGMADGNKIEYYELDDVVLNKISFTMENLKEYGDLIYSFFKGPGKKYYYTEEDRKTGKVKGIDGYYEEKLIKDFVIYTISYCKSHKSKKYVLEGIWILDFIEPSLLKDYAVYIKGTSFIKSTIRAANREVKYASDGENRLKLWFDRATNLKIFVNLEKELKMYRDYFTSQDVNEYTFPYQYPYEFVPESNTNYTSPLARLRLGRIQIREFDQEYGLPDLNKYPMPDEKHVISAIRFFNYVDKENEAELAKNIKKKMRKYNISYSKVGEKNRLKKYLKEDTDIVSEWCFDNFDTKPVLVFDIGSVLVDFKYSLADALRQNKLIPNELAEEIDIYITNTYKSNSDYLEYCSSMEYVKFMMDKAPIHIKKYIPVALKINISNASKLPYTDSLLKQLSNKYKLLYLSNWGRYGRDELLKNKTFDFLKYFDGGIFSCDVGCMKPDHKIYKELFKKYEVEGNQCIFFDDNSDNIRASIECGMYGVLFNKDYTPQWIRDNLL